MDVHFLLLIKASSLSLSSVSLWIVVLARAKGTEHDHSIYVCTVFFLYIVHEPPLRQLSASYSLLPSPRRSHYLSVSYFLRF